jgi:hypothetical protein
MASFATENSGTQQSGSQGSQFSRDKSDLASLVTETLASCEAALRSPTNEEAWASFEELRLKAHPLIKADIWNTFKPNGSHLQDPAQLSSHLTAAAIYKLYLTNTQSGMEESRDEWRSLNQHLTHWATTSGNASLEKEGEKKKRMMHAVLYFEPWEFLLPHGMWAELIPLVIGSKQGGTGS